MNRTVCIVAAAAVLLCPAHAAAQDRGAAVAMPTLDGVFFLRADRLTYDNKKKIFTAEGGVEITRGALVVHADKAVMYEEEDVLEAEGNVSLFDGTNVVFAQKTRVQDRGLVGSLVRGTIMVKKTPDPQTLAKLNDPECARRAGRNRLYLEGDRIERTAERHYKLFDSTFTPCDCGDEPPSWKLRALRTWADLDEQAVLLLPVVYADDLPVMVLPALMLPVGERRSGFLFPRFGFTGRDGAQLQNSLFLTLGRSADLTAEANFIQERGMKWGLESRWAPSNTAWGRFYGSFINDTKDFYDRNRWLVQQSHFSKPADRLYVTDRLHLVSDNAYPSDFMFDIWEREAEYLKSDVNVVKTFDDVVIGAGAAYYQDMKRGGHDLFDRFGARTVQQLPYASFGLALKEAPAIPVAFSLEAGYVHYYDPVRPYADYGRDATGFNDFGYSKPDRGEFNHAYEPGEPVRRAHRLTLYPTLAVPVNLWSIARWNNAFSLRHTFYDSEISRDFPRHTGYGVLKSGVETEVSRAFAVDMPDVAGMKHSVVPGAEYRWIPFDYQRGGHPVLIDEIDSVSGLHQVMFSLHNRLDYRRPWGQYGRYFDVGVMQGVDVDPPEGGSRLSPFGVEVLASAGGFSTRDYLGYEWNETGLSEFASVNSISDRRGDSFGVMYTYLPRSGRTHFSQGLEELFASRFDRRLKAFGKINEVTATAAAKVVKGLVATYMANYSLITETIIVQSFGLQYRSPCDCWSLQATMNLYHYQDMPDFFIIFDMSTVGEVKG
ncbi:MAG: LPS assembly protein LptD [Deltaproteobacteria bacterium]|nr:LPS assembly protein LptD [Deltaproteobacteria bacterium]